MGSKISDEQDESADPLDPGSQRRKEILRRFLSPLEDVDHSNVERSLDCLHGFLHVCCHAYGTDEIETPSRFVILKD